MTKGKLNVWEILRISSGLGLTIALPISGGTIFGFFLDQNLHTKPVFTLVFLFLGLFLAMMGVLRKIRQLQGEEE